MKKFRAWFAAYLARRTERRAQCEKERQEFIEEMMARGDLF